MEYRPDLYPEDWKHGEEAFAKAFTTRDARALVRPPPHNELLFRRLCLAHDDFEDADYAAGCLIDWDKSGHPCETVAIVERPEHMQERRNLLLRNCYETTMTIAYARPFTDSNGLPAVGFRAIGLTPKASTTELHQKLMKYRHRRFAHSDQEVRKFLPPVLVDVNKGTGTPLERMSNPIFPKGGVFSEAEVHQIATMIYEVRRAIRKTMLGMVDHLAEPLHRYVPESIQHDGPDR